MERLLTKEVISHIGKKVRLNGWVHVTRRLGKMVFVELRDVSGIVQVVFTPDKKDVLETAKKLRPEFVVEIVGTVAQRPEKLVNKEMPTGTVEIQAEGLKILAESKTPPFEIVETEKEEVGEELRFKYRYLDLRRARNQRSIIIRSKLVKYIRDFLHKEGFIEIETPILAKSTPEGARDYLVPSRQYPGKFYALPQSPQQYKQLLMIAGFDKYFQIAPCFRDEDARADRAPDQFFQLDLEMSFVEQADVLDLIERLYAAMVKELFPEKKITFSPWPRIPYAEAMKKYGNDKPDLRKDKNDPNELAFVFIVDWPFFEAEKKDGKYVANHHIFTAPHSDDVALLETDPGRVRSWQHDIALNGNEIAGGSIRSTDPKVLEKVLELVGVTKEEAKTQFGHMMEAFEYGVPPHGGIACGIDRLLAILLRAPNIREVVAFPKTGDNREPMTGSPSAASEQQLKELRLNVTKK
ncbi:MAG: aspartate--tRNA ligase [Patescibacteria group bacterium]|nr:aspartate--tRNA ligase [Patescibacteria group bacterium]MDD5715339.1 aspartate--tRNA ligase [Patescibacteria group bacterium]